MSSNPYHNAEDRQSSSDMSTVDLSSRSSSVYLDHPSQQQRVQDEQQQIRNHHKLRTSPKCSPLRPSEEGYSRGGTHGSTSSTHQRRFTSSSIDSSPQHQTTALWAREPPSFITINPGSRRYSYIFLLFVAFAIVHAVFQGFENMYNARQSQSTIYQPELSKETMIADEDELPQLNNKMKYDNRSTNENREGGTVISAATSAVSTEPSATVLSRTSQLSYLISNLGAGDVVECYVVTRMAQLTNVVSTVSLADTANSGGSRNLDAEDVDSTKQSQETVTAASTTTSNQPTGPILIRKSGLAFRYRPRVASAASNSPETPNTPKFFEITLEYGPQRTGSTKSFESLPMLHMDTETDSSNNKYVSWENEGRVYHSTHISSDWTEAYYMAPITGVVLEKILQRAVDYPRKRPRYQPFEVVSVPSGNLIVRSSGSDDFVWEMFRDLADLYVEIDPILVPPRGTIQFYVADAVPNQKEDDEEAAAIYSAKRIEPNPNVQRVKGGLEAGRAAAFYEKFYNCASAIKTGDYSMFLPPATPEPTSAPSDTTTAFPSPLPPDAETALPSMAPSKAAAGELMHIDIGDDVASNSTVVDVGDSETFTNEQNLDDPSDRNERVDAKNAAQSDVFTATNSTDGDLNSVGPLLIRFLRSMEDRNDSAEIDAGSIDSEYTNSTSDQMQVNDGNHTLDADEEEDVAEAAEKLQQAAVEAAENAANVASKNSSPADSAAAASQAAEAAKKAKDASIAARNKVASEGIISGDGALATSILSTCFSDPKYGILQKDEVKESHGEESEHDERGTSEEAVQIRESIHAYVYLDGNTFFRLNLTAPYWGTASTFQTVPQPSLKPEGWGDAVDWAIFVIIFFGALFGFLVMLHQGGCCTIDKRLRFSSFFKPTEHDKVDLVDVLKDQDALRRGGGFAHSIGIDAIPTSMGGRLSLYSDNVETPSSSEAGSTTMLLEMTHQRTVSNGMAPGSGDTLPSSLRIRRDAPDQVERPTLITTSKPAIPQQSPRDDDTDSKSDIKDFKQDFNEALDSCSELVPPFS